MPSALTWYLARGDLDDGHPLGVALPVGHLHLLTDLAGDALHALPPNAHGLASLGDFGFQLGDGDGCCGGLRWSEILA